MRPFNVEYQALAGFHDGVRTRVVDSAARNALILLHESMHGRIFRETPDGQIHAAYCKAVEQKHLTGQVARAVAESSQTFFEASRVPHEAFATYLSCKALPPADQTAASGQLTPQYTEYFRLLSEVIDLSFRSTHLQFLVAWNCAVAVFSSPLLERFPSLDMNVPIHLSEDEHPGYRFEALLKTLRQTSFDVLNPLLEQTARTACAQAGLTYWNIFSEAAWHEATFPNGKMTNEPVKIEIALSDLLREWLLKSVPFTFLHGSCLQAAFKKYPESLKRQLNFSSYQWANMEIDGAVYDAELVAVAATESTSRIVNSRSYPLRCLDDLASRTEALLRESSSIAIYSACPPQRNMTHWAIFAWGKGLAIDSFEAPYFFAEFPRTDVLTFLRRWIDAREWEHDVPHLRILLIAVQDALELIRIMKDIGPTLSTDYETCSRLCWYWWGRAFDIYPIFASRQRELLLGEVHTYESEDKRPRQPLTVLDEPVGLIVRLLHFGKEARTGLIMRALSHYSGSAIHGIESALLADERLKRMPSEMVERFLPLVKEALYGAQSLWREY